MRGANIPEVQQALGHKTVAMTMRYAHLSADHMRAAMNLLDEPAAMGTQEEATATHTATHTATGKAPFTTEQPPVQPPAKKQVPRKPSKNRGT